MANISTDIERRASLSAIAELLVFGFDNEISEMNEALLPKAFYTVAEPILNLHYRSQKQTRCSRRL